MIDIKKILILLLVTLSIIVTKENVFEAEKNKNTELKNEIETIKIGKRNSYDRVIDEEILNEKENVFLENKDNEIGNDDCRVKSTQSGKNREKIKLFCKEISQQDCVKKIENNSLSDENSYIIVMNTSITDFRKIMKTMDKAGFKILINKMRYDKMKNLDEYSILVNIF